MTTPAEIYEEIIATEPPDLDERVLSVIKQRGEAEKISRRALIEAVFGVKLKANEDLANNHYDRQIRRSIARLQKHHPILSSSGKGGYWYGSPSETLEYVVEIRSRAIELLEKASDLEKMAVALASDVKQMGLGI